MDADQSPYRQAFQPHKTHKRDLISVQFQNFATFNQRNKEPSPKTRKGSPAQTSADFVRTKFDQPMPTLYYHPEAINGDIT